MRSTHTYEKLNYETISILFAIFHHYNLILSIIKSNNPIFTFNVSLLLILYSVMIFPRIYKFTFYKYHGGEELFYISQFLPVYIL
jgi:hypothetical protein